MSVEFNLYLMIRCGFLVGVAVVKAEAIKNYIHSPQLISFSHGFRMVISTLLPFLYFYSDLGLFFCAKAAPTQLAKMVIISACIFIDTVIISDAGAYETFQEFTFTFLEFEHNGGPSNILTKINSIT